MRLWIALLAHGALVAAFRSPQPLRVPALGRALHAGRGARSAALRSVADGGSGGRCGDERDGRGGGGGGGGDDEGGRGGGGGGNPLARAWTSLAGDAELIEELKMYATTIVVCLAFRFAIVEPRYIPSLSMFPTFEVGDQLAVEKVSKWYSSPRRNDVVVFNPPAAFRELFEPLGGGKGGGFFDFLAGGDSSQASEALIKRVVAVEGDTVRVADGTLYVNGVAQEERFVTDRPAYAWGPQQVPAGCLMVLGDNRNHSLDSHVWGFLPKENVIGRAVFKYWPVWRARGIEGVGTVQ